jgi:hypothetical protein
MTRPVCPTLQGSEDGESGDTIPVRQHNGGNGGGGGTVPTCQVEKCRKELTGLTTYHQRCRICEASLHLAHEHVDSNPCACMDYCGICDPICSDTSTLAMT